MVETKSLHEFNSEEIPRLISELLLGEWKLYALVAEAGGLYFVPSKDPEDYWFVESGRYEVEDVGSIIEDLESLYAKGAIPKKGSLRETIHRARVVSFRSPEGVKGVFVDSSCPSPEKVFDDFTFFCDFPFTRLVIDRSPVPDDGCGIKTPEHKVMVAVHREFWADGEGASQEAIRQWIRDSFSDLDLGKVRTEYIERFCRPNDRREGRRPTKKG